MSKVDNSDATGGKTRDAPTLTTGRCRFPACRRSPTNPHWHMTSGKAIFTFSSKKAFKERLEKGMPAHASERNTDDMDVDSGETLVCGKRSAATADESAASSMASQAHTTRHQGPSAIEKLKNMMEDMVKEVKALRNQVKGLQKTLGCVAQIVNSTEGVKPAASDGATASSG